MDNEEKRARLILALDYKISLKNFNQLLKNYKSAKAVLENTREFNKIKKSLNSDKGRLGESINLNEVLVLGEQKYPKLLSNISDPPICLFYKGDIEKIDFEKCIGVVGTRKFSNYGATITKKLVSFLIEHGNIVVSGLAYGIDALAHEESLSNSGQTIAVLGTGINQPYPQANKWLYKKILENNGLILSESYEDIEYNKWIFPKRNRIIAGLSKKLIVVEAPIKSGALITADLANGYSHEVYAIPGDIFSQNSEGVHKIIKDNKAIFLYKFEDLFEDEQFVFKINNQTSSYLNDDEAKGHYDKSN